jgi:hypothetical protein
VKPRALSFAQVIFAIAAIGAITAFWTAVALFVLHRPSSRVLGSWAGEGGGYHLTVLETDWDYRGFPFTFERNVEVYVGRDAGQPTYGHFVKYSFTRPFGETLDQHVRTCTVTWAGGGVTLAEPDGHRLYVPGAAYRGGR